MATQQRPRNSGNSAIRWTTNQLITWINGLLQLHGGDNLSEPITSMRETTPGCYYAQVLDSFLPGKVNMANVVWGKQGELSEYEVAGNLKVVVSTLQREKIGNPVDFNSMVKARPAAVLEFMQWLKNTSMDPQYEDASNYDARGRRSLCKLGSHAKRNRHYSSQRWVGADSIGRYCGRSRTSGNATWRRWDGRPRNVERRPQSPPGSPSSRAWKRHIRTGPRQQVLRGRVSVSHPEDEANQGGTWSPMHSSRLVNLKSEHYQGISSSEVRQASFREYSETEWSTEGHISPGNSSQWSITDTSGMPDGSNELGVLQVPDGPVWEKLEPHSSPSWHQRQVNKKDAARESGELGPHEPFAGHGLELGENWSNQGLPEEFCLEPLVPRNALFGDGGDLLQYHPKVPIGCSLHLELKDVGLEDRLRSSLIREGSGAGGRGSVESRQVKIAMVCGYEFKHFGHLVKVGDDRDDLQRPRPAKRSSVLGAGAGEQGIPLRRGQKSVVELEGLKEGQLQKEGDTGSRGRGISPTKEQGIPRHPPQGMRVPGLQRHRTNEGNPVTPQPNCPWMPQGRKSIAHGLSKSPAGTNAGKKKRETNDRYAGKRKVGLMYEEDIRDQKTSPNQGRVSRASNQSHGQGTGGEVWGGRSSDKENLEGKTDGLCTGLRSSQEDQNNDDPRLLCTALLRHGAAAPASGRCQCGRAKGSTGLLAKNDEYGAMSEQQARGGRHGVVRKANQGQPHRQTAASSGKGINPSCNPIGGPPKHAQGGRKRALHSTKRNRTTQTLGPCSSMHGTNWRSGSLVRGLPQGENKSALSLTRARAPGDATTSAGCSPQRQGELCPSCCSRTFSMGTEGLTRHQRVYKRAYADQRVPSDTTGRTFPPVEAGWEEPGESAQILPALRGLDRRRSDRKKNGLCLPASISCAKEERSAAGGGGKERPKAKWRTDSDSLRAALQEARRAGQPAKKGRTLLDTHNPRSIQQSTPGTTAAARRFPVFHHRQQ